MLTVKYSPKKYLPNAIYQTRVNDFYIGKPQLQNLCSDQYQYSTYGSVKSRQMRLIIINLHQIYNLSII